MNCEVCVQKFKDIESLIKHEASECHQENVKKHQNALLDYSAKEVPAILGDIPLTSAESVAVSAENVEVATESNPIVAEVAPEAYESASVAIESIPFTDEAVPNAAPIVSNSKIKNDYLFSCTACSMGFSNLSNVIQHSESKLHTTMVLATGIGFDEQANISENYTDLFPALYYCIVCNFRCFDSKIYDVHLKMRIHRRIVQLMSNLLKENATDICFNEITSMNSSKLPAKYYCKLCDIQFKNTNCYRDHIKGKKHQRILMLMKKIVHGKKENFAVCFNVEEVENLNTSQYYCELCNISGNSNHSENHLKWKTHKRVEQYMNTMYCGNYENIDMFDDSDFQKCKIGHCRLYYCGLCSIWCFGCGSYENHLKGKKHCRNTGQKRIDADPKSPDNINDSSPSSYYCEVCNIRCSSSKGYENHLNGKKHSRKTGQKQIDADPKSTDNINDPSPSSRFCEVCNIQCVTSKSFKNHMKSKIHIRIKQIVSELFEMKKEDAVSCFNTHGDTDESLHLPCYCKLCDVVCTSPKSYKCHLKGKTHKAIKRIVSTLSNEAS